MNDRTAMEAFATEAEVLESSNVLPLHQGQAPGEEEAPVSEIDAEEIAPKKSSKGLLIGFCVFLVVIVGAIVGPLALKSMHSGRKPVVADAPPAQEATQIADAAAPAAVPFGLPGAGAPLSDSATVPAAPVPTMAPVTMAPVTMQPVTAPAPVQQNLATPPASAPAMFAPAPAMTVSPTPASAMVASMAPSVPVTAPAMQPVAAMAPVSDPQVRALHDELDMAHADLTTANSKVSELQRKVEKLTTENKKLHQSPVAPKVAKVEAVKVEAPVVLADASKAEPVAAAPVLKEAAKPPKAAKATGPKIRSDYELHAIRDGRAWVLEKSTSEQMRIEVGFVFPDNSKVIAMDEDKAIVETTDGLIQYPVDLR